MCEEVLLYCAELNVVFALQSFADGGANAARKKNKFIAILIFGLMGVMELSGLGSERRFYKFSFSAFEQPVLDYFS